MNAVNNTNIFIFGGSGGLGQALAKELLLFKSESHLKAYNFSRRPSNFDYDIKCDLSKTKESLEIFKKQFEELNPTAIFFLAGGGPFGSFVDKEFKDHEWALNVNFITPLAMIHHAQLVSKVSLTLICIGSQISETKAHKNGLAYGAAKSAMSASVRTLQSECDPEEMAFHLYRLGYMDTPMLTKNSVPRANNETLLNPKGVVGQILKNFKIKSNQHIEECLV